MLLPKPHRLRLDLNDYNRMKQELFEKYNWRCAKCGRIRPLTLDHKRKRSQGGGDEDGNTQPLCSECHDEKDNVARSKSKYWND
jgi:5-methylcytosine-specific restriction endonuclease McrA